MSGCQRVRVDKRSSILVFLVMSERSVVQCPNAACLAFQPGWNDGVKIKEINDTCTQYTSTSAIQSDPSDGFQLFGLAVKV